MLSKNLYFLIIMTFGTALFFALCGCRKNESTQSSNSIILSFARKPYTLKDLGIDPEMTGQKATSLPAISASEAEAIEDACRELEAQGLMTVDAWKKSSIEAWKTIRFTPLSDFEIDDKIFREMKNESVPEKVSGTKEELFKKESENADAFFSEVEKNLPELSLNDLINIRKQFTVSLALLRLQMDFRDVEDGIPEEFLLMVQHKTALARQKVTDELLKRGVTQL